MEDGQDVRDEHLAFFVQQVPESVELSQTAPAQSMLAFVASLTIEAGQDARVEHLAFFVCTFSS
eukprot:COSAG01_NODE_31245_length_601_cov_0.766932_1_plen_63_part_10